MHIRFFFLILISCFQLNSDVIIIGGGPAGLASAIEARLQGFDVTIIEKRPEYTRLQMIFLLEPSLTMLEKWGIEVPNLNRFHYNEIGVGTISIKYLEQGLAARVKELGIKKIEAEFIDFGENAEILIRYPDQTIDRIPYTFVIGADGTHSRFREKLDIPCHLLGHAQAKWMIVNFADPIDTCEVSRIVIGNKCFIRKICIWDKGLIFLQSLPNQLDNFFAGTCDELSCELKEIGWEAEAEALAAGPLRQGVVEVFHQQADCFVNEKASALLIGDAAASTSFFYGMGVNTALACAEQVGNFFKHIREENPDAFTTFNQEIKKATDQLINNSAFLFTELHED